MPAKTSHPFLTHSRKYAPDSDQLVGISVWVSEPSLENFFEALALSMPFLPQYYDRATKLCFHRITFQPPKYERCKNSLCVSEACIRKSSMARRGNAGVAPFPSPPPPSPRRAAELYAKAEAVFSCFAPLVYASKVSVFSEPNVT